MLPLMAYSDPQSVTVSGTASSLPRTSSGTNSGAFQSPDGAIVLKVSNAYGKRNRRTVRLEHAKIAADPLTAANTKFSMTAYVVVDTPVVGYSVAEAQAVVAALTKWLTDTSGSNVAKLLGGEN
jgi:hypothetical protein